MKNKTISYDQLIKQHLKILKSLQYESGLFAASGKAVSTGYDKSWLRDNFYECIAFTVIGDWDAVEHTYSALLKIFLKHEKNIDHAITHKPTQKHEYIHARFNPDTFEEYWEEWGNKQNDSIGAILYMIGELEHRHNRSVLDSGDKVRIVQKLVHYLESIEYWHDEDSGMWENEEEIHTSSIGACVAGLKSIARLPRVEVSKDVINKGIVALENILPRESKKKFVDLSLLSLIYPYNITTEEQRDKILENVEYHLLRKKGVVRYKNDPYYNKNEDGISEEAEWVFGLSWLTLIYIKMGNKAKAQKFINKAIAADSEIGVPELYFSNSDKFNENTPLGWSESLFITALHEMNTRFIKSSNITQAEINKEYQNSYKKKSN